MAETELIRSHSSEQVVKQLYSHAVSGPSERFEHSPPILRL
jgi:hypothetical protein